MKHSVFISYASQDKEAAQQLLKQLELHDVEAWAAFRDIDPGFQWDMIIQEVMDEVSHIVVLVSQASISSSYVRAEVEYALDNNKTVIPVLVEQVKLPLRWHNLQYVDLRNKEEDEGTIKTLIANLPKSSISKLREYLSNPYDSKLVKELLLENIGWLAHPEATFSQKTSIRERLFSLAPLIDPHRIDWLMKTLTTLLEFSDCVYVPGLEYIGTGFIGTSENSFYLICLCSPYEPPFDSTGILTSELEALLDKLAIRLAVPSAKIFVLAGLRQHYDDSARSYRINLQEKWAANVMKKPSIMKNASNINSIQLEIVSYTRLLHKVIQNTRLLS